MATIRLTGNYGYTPYIGKDLAAGTVINASGATWIQDNDARDGQSSDYPFRIYDAPGVVLDGGKIDGRIDLTTEWRTIYDLGNSAAIRIEESANAVIRGWELQNTWDSIRVSWNSPNFLIEDVRITNGRDDAVENDRLQSGTIRDSLFDGVFAGLSIDPSSSSPVDGHNNTVTMDGVLLRLKSFLYEGKITHASFIKTDSATNGEVTPNLRFVNCVFALEDVNHRSYRSMFDAWSNTTESKNNVFLNLSDTPLPSDYPKPPSGWTILQGQQARDYWAKARADWIDRHDGEDNSSGSPSAPPVVTEPGGSTPTVPDVDEPTAPTAPTSPTTPSVPSGSEPGAPTFSGIRFVGGDKGELIIGNTQNNNIDGDGGNDRIYGGAGNDTLRGDEGADNMWGGAGNDTFFFKRLSDSSQKYGVDTIRDFAKGDKIDLSAIDANDASTGNQAFAITTGSLGKTPGQLKVAYDAPSNTTVVTGSVDKDADPEILFQLTGKVDLSASDFIL